MVLLENGRFTYFLGKELEMWENCCLKDLFQLLPPRFRVELKNREKLHVVFLKCITLHVGQELFSWFAHELQ